MKTKCPQCENAKEVIQHWLDKQGHERCWCYPDLFNELIELFDIHSSEVPSLPPRKEFEAGCKRYQDEEYGR